MAFYSHKKIQKWINVALFELPKMPKTYLLFGNNDNIPTMPRFWRFLKICPFGQKREKTLQRFDPLSGLGIHRFPKVSKWHFCVFFDPFVTFNVKTLILPKRATARLCACFKMHCAMQKSGAMSAKRELVAEHREALRVRARFLPISKWVSDEMLTRRRDSYGRWATATRAVYPAHI